MVIVNRITPPEIVVIVCRVIDRTVVKVEVCVTMPRPPTVGRCVALNHSNFRLPAVRGDFKVLYINLLATFGNNMEFHPSIFDMTGCRDLNMFGAIFCSEDKGIAVTCLFSVFIVVATTRRLAFGITDPGAPCDRFFIVFNFEPMRFTPVAYQHFNVLCPYRNLKEVYRAGDCEFVVLCVLSVVCPSGESNTVFKPGTGSNCCIPAFYPFINIACNAMLATQSVCVIVVVCIRER